MTLMEKHLFVAPWPPLVHVHACTCTYMHQHAHTKNTVKITYMFNRLWKVKYGPLMLSLSSSSQRLKCNLKIVSPFLLSGQQLHLPLDHCSLVIQPSLTIVQVRLVFISVSFLFTFCTGRLASRELLMWLFLGEMHYGTFISWCHPEAVHTECRLTPWGIWGSLFWAKCEWTWPRNVDATCPEWHVTCRTFLNVL